MLFKQNFRIILKDEIISTVTSIRQRKNFEFLTGFRPMERLTEEQGQTLGSFISKLKTHHHSLYQHSAILTISRTCVM